jgi:hypothetical protein
LRPREECENGSRGPGVIAEIKVVSPGIVEVYRLLDEAQTEYVGIEVQISLWIAGYGGHVMKSYDWLGRHFGNSFDIIRFDIEIKGFKSR